MPKPKAARWLDLIAYLLQHRFAVTRDQIFEHVTDYREASETGTAEETVRRKFERVKDELRTLGVEIQTVQLQGTPGDEDAVGYRLSSGDFYLPYLELAEAETTAPRPYRGLANIAVSKPDLALLDRATRRLSGLVGFPLAAAAASARRKLQFDLPLPVHAVEQVLSRPPGELRNRCPTSAETGVRLGPKYARSGRTLGAQRKD